MVGAPLPLTRFTALDGTYEAFSRFQGQRLVVVFWAEWCPHSRSLIEGLGKVASKVKGSDIVFLAVSVDDAGDLKRVREWLGSRNMEGLTIAFSGNALFDEAYEAFGGGDLPHAFFVEKNGMIVGDGHSLSDIDDIVERWQEGETIELLARADSPPLFLSETSW